MFAFGCLRYLSRLEERRKRDQPVQTGLVSKESISPTRHTPEGVPSNQWQRPPISAWDNPTNPRELEGVPVLLPEMHEQKIRVQTWKHFFFFFLAVGARYNNKCLNSKRDQGTPKQEHITYCCRHAQFKPGGSWYHRCQNARVPQSAIWGFDWIYSLNPFEISRQKILPCRKKTRAPNMFTHTTRARTSTPARRTLRVGLSEESRRRVVLRASSACVGTLVLIHIRCHFCKWTQLEILFSTCGCCWGHFHVFLEVLKASLKFHTHTHTPPWCVCRLAPRRLEFLAEMGSVWYSLCGQLAAKSRPWVGDWRSQTFWSTKLAATRHPNTAMAGNNTTIKNKFSGGFNIFSTHYLLEALQS